MTDGVTLLMVITLTPAIFIGLLWIGRLIVLALGQMMRSAAMADKRFRQ